MGLNLTPEQRDFIKRKLILVGVVVLVLVSIGLLIWFLTKTSRSCELTSTEPEGSDSIGLASDDYTALVRFDGYIKFYPENNNSSTDKYLPLKLYSVKDELLRNSQYEQKRVLSIDLYCAQLKIYYTKDTKYDLLPVYFHEAHATVQPQPEITSGTINCKLPTNPFTPYILIGHHYSCERQTSLLCHGKNFDNWNLLFVFNIFEFEVNGDPEKIRELEFSTPREDCK